MASLSLRPAAFELPTPAVAAGERTIARIRLACTGDGWSLVGSDGKVVFEALGVSGRRRCLEFARAHGALAVFS